MCDHFRWESRGGCNGLNWGGNLFNQTSCLKKPNNLHVLPVTLFGKLSACRVAGAVSYCSEINLGYA